VRCKKRGENVKAGTTCFAHRAISKTRRSSQSRIDAGRRSTRNVSGSSAFDTCGLSRRINRDKSPIRARAGTCRRASTAISGCRMSSRPLSFSLAPVVPFVPKILPVYYRLHQHVVPRRGSCRQAFTSLLLVAISRSYQLRWFDRARTC